MVEVIEQLRLWAEQVIMAFGYPGITLLMLVENIFPPIPSEVVIPFAGFLVARGSFTLWGVILAGSLGSALGAIVLYYAGYWADEFVVRKLVRRHGVLLGIGERDLDRAFRWFDRYGEAVVLFGRVIPLARSLVSIPAGMHRMPLGRFLLFTILGSSLWTGALAYAGVVLGENWQQVLGILVQYQRLTLIVYGILLVLFLVRLVWPRVHQFLPAAREEE